MAKSVISLALIGITNSDEDQLLFSINLQKRFELSAAFSACYQKLEAFAKQLKIVPMGSCRQLMCCPQIDGLIWNGDAAESQPEKLGLGASAKHLLIRAEVLQQFSLERILLLQEQAATSQTEILPGLLHRWNPVTLRLRELIATQLGPIEKIRVNQCSQQTTLPELFHIVDWLRMLLSIKHCTVTANNSDFITIDFQRADHKSVTCDISLSSDSNDANKDDTAISINCESGQVEIKSTQNLRWKTNSDWNDETLQNERTAEQVMLDLFGRRIAGGIVPVPDLMEVLRTQRLLAVIEESQFTGQPIHIDETSLPVNDGKFCT